MRNIRSHLVLALGLLVYGSACATMPAPRGFLPTRATLGQDTHGAWAVVTLAKGLAKDSRIRGELIAVDAGFVRVLTSDGLVTVGTERLRRVRLQIFEPRTRGAAAWTALGTLATLSHGAYLVFTAPAWLISGGAALGSETGSALLEHPPVPLEAMSAFARFPQGYPSGLPESELGTLRVPGGPRPERP